MTHAHTRIAVVKTVWPVCECVRPGFAVVRLSSLNHSPAFKEARWLAAYTRPHPIDPSMLSVDLVRVARQSGGGEVVVDEGGKGGWVGRHLSR